MNNDQYKLLKGRRVAWALTIAILAFVLAASATPAMAQESEEAEDEGAPGGQSLESAANDATASMWTFQLSLEGRTWLDEDGPSGQPRPEGNRDQFMLRFVAPVPLGKNLKLINRFTMRNNEAADKSSGAGDAEYFALFIPFEWATGRWGIGPQLNFRSEERRVGKECRSRWSPYH